MNEASVNFATLQLLRLWPLNTRSSRSILILFLDLALESNCIQFSSILFSFNSTIILFTSSTSVLLKFRLQAKL